MKELARLRILAAKAARLSLCVGDDATIIILKAYALECRLDADCREAHLANRDWHKRVV